MKNIIRIAQANIFLKAIQVISTSYYLGLLSRQLSTFEFGEIMLLISLQAFTLNLDFGLGQALRNKVVELRSVGDNFHLISKYMSSVLFFLAITALFLTFFAFNPIMSIQKLIYENAIKSPNLNSLKLIQVFLISQILTVPLNSLILIFYSFHRSIAKSFFEATTPFLIAILLKILQTRVDLTGLLIFFIPILVNSLSLIYLLVTQKIQIDFKKIDFKYILELWAKGKYFWLLSISSSIFFGTDMLLISFKFDQIVSSQYAIIQRPVILILGLHFLVLSPLWSYYTDLFYAGRLFQAKKLLDKTLKYTLALFFLGTFVYSVFYKDILLIWFNKTIESRSTVILAGFWSLLYGVLNCTSVFLNGIGNIKIQTIVLFICSIINIPLSLYLMELFKINGTIISSIILIIFPIAANLITLRKYNAIS